MPIVSLWYAEEEHVTYEIFFFLIRLVKYTSTASNTVWFMTILGYPLPFSAFLQWQMEENIFPILRVSCNCAQGQAPRGPQWEVVLIS